MNGFMRSSPPAHGKPLQTVQAVKMDRDDPRLLALQVEALLALNRNTDAHPLVKQLWNEGYRDAELVDVLQRARFPYPVNPAFQRQLAQATRTKPSPAAGTPAGNGSSSGKLQ